MRQQINLYQPIFRKQNIIFSAQSMLWLALGFVVLLMLWSFLIGKRISDLESALERQQDAEQRAIAQLTQMRLAMPPTEPSAQLERELERLNARRGELRASLRAVAQRQPAADARLHEKFDALARQRPQGLWLTELRLGENDARLSLHGRALAARLIPEYLQALSNEPLLDGTGFRQIRVEESPDGRPGVAFVISTEASRQP